MKYKLNKESDAWKLLVLIFHICMVVNIFGFIAPALISAPSTILVCLGIVVIVATIAYYANKICFDNSKLVEKQNEHQ